MSRLVLAVRSACPEGVWCRADGMLRVERGGEISSRLTWRQDFILSYVATRFHLVYSHARKRAATGEGPAASSEGARFRRVERGNKISSCLLWGQDFIVSYVATRFHLVHAQVENLRPRGKGRTRRARGQDFVASNVGTRFHRVLCGDKISSCLFAR